MSEINPYAAPLATAVPQTGGSDGGDGTPQPWEVGEVFSASWSAFKRQWPVLLGSLIVFYVISFVVQQVIGAALGFGGPAVTADGRPDFGSFGLRMGVITIASMLVNAFLQVGWLRIFLAAVRGESPQFGMLFSGGSRYLPMLGSSLLVLAGIYLGIVLLVVPGVILSLGLAFTMFYAADTELGAIESIKASWNATSGQRGKIFVFFLAAFFANVVGAIACGVGVLVSAPVTFLAMAVIYTRISGRLAPSAA